MELLARNITRISRLLYRSCSTEVVARSTPRLSNEEVRKKRNKMFEEQLEFQKSLIGRVEKIQVQVKNPLDTCTLVMNKDISTPYNCAMHIAELLTKQSVVALVNGQLWDMHSPLTDDCELEFLHFKQQDPRPVNKVFWRSCSFLLGYLIERAFRDEFFVELKNWPTTNVFDGRFIYDVDLKMKDWTPSKAELQSFTTMMIKACGQNFHFQRLEVDAIVALRMFEDNRFKKEVISEIAEQFKNKVPLYRVNDHIDISKGPMISNMNIIGKYEVAAVHRLETESGVLHRFQGVALPLQLPLNSYVFSILVKRAARLDNFQHLQKTKEETVSSV